MKNQKRRGLLATIGAVAAGAVLALSGMMAANAVPTIPPTSPNSTLTITKYDLDHEGPAGPANGLVAGSGSPAVPAGATAIENVGFTIKRVISYVETGETTPVVTVDLNTNAGWQAAGQITFDAATGVWQAPSPVPADNGALVEITPTFATAVGPQLTDGSGQTAFTVPNGLYLVMESSTPAGVTPSAPFIVALPLTDPVNLNSWMHNVHVYPKNSRIDAIKTVDDATPFTVTDQQRITYTIAADVPRNPGSTAGTFADPTGFMITDQLENEFTPVSVTASITPSSAGITLTPVTDYTVTPASFAAGDEIEVEFTPAGLVKLGDAAPTENAKVVVEIVVDVDDTITSMGALDILGNVAKVFPDQASIDADEVDERWIETTNVDTKWGSFTFTKVNQDGDDLENAEFHVATSYDNAHAEIFIRSAEVVSDNNGVVTLLGLRASDFAKNESQNLGVETTAGSGTFDALNSNYAVYWLTETQAPTGYELLAEPIPVALLADGSVKQIAQNADRSLQYNSATGEAVFVGDFTDVINVEANAGFTLPLTGGTGTILLTIGGLAVLALVIVVASRRRMAKSEE